MAPCLAHTFYFLFPFSSIFYRFRTLNPISFFCLPFYFPSISVAQERLKAIRTIHRRCDVPRLLLGAEGVVNDNKTREDRKAKDGRGKKKGSCGRERMRGRTSIQEKSEGTTLSANPPVSDLLFD